MRVICIALLLAGCAIHEPRSVTNARWCDHGRDAVIEAVNARNANQRGMIKQDWTDDAWDYTSLYDVTNEPVRPRSYKWGWDHDPIGEQWAATQWVYNLPEWRMLDAHSQEMANEYVEYCNRVNKDVDLP